MKTFKDTVIVREIEWKIEICDFNYYPNHKQEKIIIEILEKNNTEKEKIIEELKIQWLNTIIINDKFENDENEYSIQLFDLLEEIFFKYQMTHYTLNFEDDEIDDWTNFSDMKMEMQIIKTEKEKARIEKEKIFKKLNWEEVIYLKTNAKYYRPWISENLYTKSEIATIYGLDIKDVYKLHTELNIIKSYEKLEYANCDLWNYDKLKKIEIVKPLLLHNNLYTCPSKIEFLISNLCNKKQEQIEYINKMILRKIKNIWSSNIPCVVFFWNWWAWKWLFVELMKSIFWDKNVAWNLQQEQITWSFWFTWENLIAEFAEISTDNTNLDKQMWNKLKNLIWSNYFIVNKKWIQQYQIKNSTRFLISSNNMKPLQLDNWTWNRRYSIIKVWNKIEPELWMEIFEYINKNIKWVQQYVNRLEQEYWDKIPKVMPTLENEDKADLEWRSKNDINIFRDKIIEESENEKKYSVKEIWQKFRDFCSENDIDEYTQKKYLRNESPFVRKTIHYNWSKILWIMIKK